MDELKQFQQAMAEAEVLGVTSGEFLELSDLPTVVASGIDAMLASSEIKDKGAMFSAVVQAIRTQQDGGQLTGAFLTALAFVVCTTDEQFCFIKAITPWLVSHCEKMSGYMEAMREATHRQREGRDGGD